MSQLRVGDRYSRMHKGNCLPFARFLRTPPGNGRGGEEEEKQFGEEADDSLKAVLTALGFDCQAPRLFCSPSPSPKILRQRRDEEIHNRNLNG